MIDLHSVSVWPQRYDPTGIWWLSTSIAALPVMALLAALAWLRMRAHIAAVVGLAIALTIVIAVYGMPVGLAMTAAAAGAATGLFPICWIILPIIFLYRMTVETRRFEGLKASLTNVTADGRLQLLLIAFALGAFFEGAAGFGTPVAVCGAILISLGFKPLQAAGLSLFANTAPVSFGALGIPTITLQAVTGLPLMHLSRTTAIILAPFCLLVPFWLVWLYAGWKRMIEVWPAIAVAGAVYSVVQTAVAIINGPSLAAIAASISTIVALIVFLRFWKPRSILNAAGDEIAAPSIDEPAPGEHTLRETFHAWMPWLALSALVFFWGMPQVSGWLGRATVNFPIPGLDQLVDRVPPVVPRATPETAVYKLNWASATGTATMAAAILAGFLMGLSPQRQLGILIQTLCQIRFTVITIAAMLALGFITRYGGLDATLGLAFARTGKLYPFFGTLIGWIGTATTGSDTSSNVLFGSLQKLTAQQIGVSPVLMCSANSAGGVMGKMIDAQSIVVASTATENYGQEGSILRFIFWHSLAMAALVGLFVLALAYGPLRGLASP